MQSDQSTLNLIFSGVTMIAVVVGAGVAIWQFIHRYGAPAILVETVNSALEPGAAFRISLEGKSQWRITRIRPTKRTARSFELSAEGGIVDPNEGLLVHEKVGFAVVFVAPKTSRNRAIARLLIDTRVYGLERPVRVRRKSVNVVTG